MTGTTTSWFVSWAYMFAILELSSSRPRICLFKSYSCAFWESRRRFRDSTSFLRSEFSSRSFLLNPYYISKSLRILVTFPFQKFNSFLCIESVSSRVESCEESSSNSLRLIARVSSKSSIFSVKAFRSALKAALIYSVFLFSSSTYCWARLTSFSFSLISSSDVS